VIAFAFVHAVVGVYLLWAAARASFAWPWSFAAIGGPLLVANAIGSTLRRDAFDRKLSLAIAGTLRAVGLFAAAIAIMALATKLEGAVTVLCISLAIAGWGIAFGHVLRERVDQFAA
jgi:hypothetical protein